MEAERSQLGPIGPRRAHFPCCIVWTPIPFISWLIPFIGHIGICRQDGVILDFAGPIFCQLDNFAFGVVARYIQVDGNECYNFFGSQVEATWDNDLKKGLQEFQNRSYNLLSCNYHSFVANNLNHLFFSVYDKWNMVSLAAAMFLRGRWVSAASMANTFSPFAMVLTIGALLGGTTFLAGLLAFATTMTGWFLVGTYCIKGLLELYLEHSGPEFGFGTWGLLAINVCVIFHVHGC